MHQNRDSVAQCKCWNLGVGEAGPKNLGEAENWGFHQYQCNFWFLINFLTIPNQFVIKRFIEINQKHSFSASPTFLGPASPTPKFQQLG